MNLFNRLVRRLLRWAVREPSWTAQEWPAYAVHLEERMRSLRERSERATMQAGFLDPALDESFKAWGYADERWGPPPTDQRP